MNLIKWDWIQFKEGIRSTFYQLSSAALIYVYFNEVSMGYYNTFIIMQYIVLTVIAFYLYDKRYSIKDSICLAFLTVWLNSYYWEIPLHLNEVLSNGFHVGMLVQLTRLIPLIYFIPNYTIGASGKRLLLVGLGYSTITMITRLLHILPWRIGMYLYVPNRLVCLIILVKTIIEATPRQSV